ncbi:MAG: nicotinate (nicotinamide) nucleotide adenylyltransferase [Spirochaetales bacterium]|uniref:Probable nicotinate-nucleotide adenylyltransferase n=1 Tax=Candidatus Thalassospirochaeta sargassi TaxID=3119039 RepID=A0AAJ1IFI7_9SPIO|nr:nicotinate (nicotinamide) nucleotide adenylyltransferase [Spirochaetales bacterium]
MQTDIDTVIMGGTFNPVHIGHLHLAEEVRHTFNPKRIFLVPAFISAHKQGDPVISARHRLEMLRIACSESVFEIETCEIERKGVSYSIDTLRYIKEKYGLKTKPGLIIGDDLVKGFKDWKNASAVAEEANLILGCRQSDDEVFAYRHLKIDNLIIDISSSEIRKRIAEGRAFRYLIPAGVYDYIVRNKLYGEG